MSCRSRTTYTHFCDSCEKKFKEKELYRVSLRSCCLPYDDLIFDTEFCSKCVTNIEKIYKKRKDEEKGD